ncbi:MAG TPA: sigma factor [Planctomycetota bacterium]|nr:sigma factor [Planctomycetota bacterium]
MDDLEAVRRGDPDARDRWVATWWPRVYRMALGMTGREQDAEDLAQETLMTGLAALSRFRGESSESTWLYAILLRKHLSQRRRPSPPLRPVPLGREPEVDEALALLSDLPPAQKITATLFYVEGLSVREIAKSLGVLTATVKWRLFRVRQTLKRRLGSDAPRIMCKELL